MALSDFALRKRGIYGVLHVIILLLSLFLVISISVDTFKGIPFYTQSLYMKVQLWICILFLFDFLLVSCHSLSKYNCLFRLDVFTRDYLYVAFRTFGTGRLCDGNRSRLADI